MFLLPYSWFVALVGIAAVALLVWSFHSSAPRWLWALRNSLLVLIACMVATVFIVLAVTPRDDVPHNPTPETIPPELPIGG